MCKFFFKCSCLSLKVSPFSRPQRHQQRGQLHLRLLLQRQRAVRAHRLPHDGALQQPAPEHTCESEKKNTQQLVRKYIKKTIFLKLAVISSLSISLGKNRIC